MPINRNAALNYARKYWNRVTDDDKFWTSNAVVSLAAKRRAMGAPASDGWEAVFVSNGDGGENAIFRRTVGGRTEDKPDPIAIWDELDDCTHYVCRCLIKEGIDLTETPRANELAAAMINSSKARTLALKVNREQGQKVIDSGVFKPGDLVAYYTATKRRYTHTAMFIGKQTDRADDPGGISCHTVCRFEGLTEAWNGANDDAWFLHEGLSYTLIHFAEDDPKISAATRKWLPGWWKLGSDFYYVLEDGHAFSSRAKPARTNQKLQDSKTVGHYFEADQEVVFIWRKGGGTVQVERWLAPKDVETPSIEIAGLDVAATRVF
jgi:hypothetical protein